MTSLTNKTDDSRPADQISCDVGEVGEDEDTQHLQGLHPPATQRRMMALKIPSIRGNFKLLPFSGVKTKKEMNVNVVLSLNMNV
jgi:hypothetical protein